MLRKIVQIGLLAGFVLFSDILAEAEEKVSRDFFLMDTIINMSAYGEHAEEGIARAEEETERLDALLSTGSMDSEVSQINEKSRSGEAGPFTLSEDVSALLDASLLLYEETGGAFDVSIYPLVELWGFPTKEYRVPDEEEIADALGRIGSDSISFDTSDFEMSFGEPEMEIDFGGIAKGYTSERLMQIFRDAGITSGLVSLGGNVQALGTKPDGSPWKIGIRHPDSAKDFLGILEVEDKAVVTSGAYERNFEKDGKLYHHILDPATGYPSMSGLASVTIIHENGTFADGLSTALFIFGEEKAIEFWRAHSGEFQIVLFTEDGRLIASEGLEGSFSSDLPVEWIGMD